MLTQKDYCDYETCVSLKELGFVPTPTTSWSVDGRYVIHLYDAQKWLREEKDLHIEVRWYCNMWYEYEVKEAEGKVVAEGSAFSTYEEVLSTAVRMAVEYLKEK